MYVDFNAFKKALKSTIPQGNADENLTSYTSAIILKLTYSVTIGNLLYKGCLSISITSNERDLNNYYP